MASPTQEAQDWVLTLFDNIDGVPEEAARKWREHTVEEQLAASDVPEIVADLHDANGYMASWITTVMRVDSQENLRLRRALYDNLCPQQPAVAQDHSTPPQRPPVAPEHVADEELKQQAIVPNPSDVVTPPELEVQDMERASHTQPVVHFVVGGATPAAPSAIDWEATKPQAPKRLGGVDSLRADWCDDDGMASDVLYDQAAVRASISASTYSGFVVGMAEGTLDHDVFRELIRDDLYYLDEVCRLFEALAGEELEGTAGDFVRQQQPKWDEYAPGLEDLVREMGVDGELRVAGREPGEAIAGYVDWLRECAKRGAPVFLTALVPCAVTWCVIFGRWYRRVKLAGSAHPFAKWFAAYEPGYAHGRRSMERIGSALLVDKLIDERTASAVYRRSAQHEAAFFLSFSTDVAFE